MNSPKCDTLDLVTAMKDASMAQCWRMFLWSERGLDYIIGIFTLPSANEGSIGKCCSADTAWTVFNVPCVHRETDKPSHVQTQISHTEWKEHKSIKNCCLVSCRKCLGGFFELPDIVSLAEFK